MERHDGRAGQGTLPAPVSLHIKQVALKMEGEGPKRLTLSATGPAEVAAGMIQTTGDIAVTNPDLVICTSTRARLSTWS